VPGAVLATVLWMLANLGIAWYVRNIGHYNLMYGSVGAASRCWLDVHDGPDLRLIGCEFNAEYERSSRPVGNSGGSESDGWLDRLC